MARAYERPSIEENQEVNLFKYIIILGTFLVNYSCSSNWSGIFLVNYSCYLECFKKNIVNYSCFDSCPKSEALFLIWSLILIRTPKDRERTPPRASVNKVSVCNANDPMPSG